MKNKSLIFLSLIFVFLIVLISLRYRNNTKEPVIYAGYGKKVNNFKSDKADKIEIQKGNKNIVLTKKDDIWYLEGKRADKEKIDKLLTGILSPPGVDLIAKTSTVHKDLEVTKEFATMIDISGKLKLMLGKSDANGTNLRFDGDNNVFFIRGLYFSDFHSNDNDWFDKTIVSVDDKELKKLQFEKPSEKFTLIKEDNKWEIENTVKEVNMDKLTPLINYLLSYKAQNLVTDKKLVSSYPVNYELRLNLNSGKNRETLEFYKGKSDYLVKRTTDGEFFIVNEYQVKDFLVSPKDLFKS